MRHSNSNKGHRADVRENIDSSHGNREFNSEVQSCLVDTASDSPIELSSTDLDALTFMYQEEKMAMDVYNSLSEQYDTKIFDKIADAEEKHMGAVENTLLRAGADLSELQNLEDGKFLNEDLQDLYTDLLAQGSESLEEALNVGITIEEADIADLNAYLEDENLNPEIASVYANLENASNHHLEAFIEVSQNDFFIA